MKNKIQKMSLFIILVILLVGCNDKSAIIGEYHKFTTYDFKGMDIMPFGISNIKQFSQSQSQSQEIYDYFLTIQSEESDILTDDNHEDPDKIPYYSIFFHFEESDYNATVGENYIVITLNDSYESIENTSIHLVNEEIINEFVEMINKLINDN